MVRSVKAAAKRVPRKPSRKQAKLDWNRVACDVFVGGVNSPVRAFRHIGGEPVVVKRASGAHVWDVRGRRFLDCIMGWGALLLGHKAPAVVSALNRGIRAGELFGLTHPNEMALAQAIVSRVPSVERIRFTVSGTEAVMTAVRLSRACTGRDKILLFDGCYHGHSDTLMAGANAGIPASWSDSVVRVAFNDQEALKRAFAAQGSALACAVVEPVAANIGVLAPEPGFLQLLRRLTTEAGALLIFDEVVTGFRLCNGSAQAVYGVCADLTTFGKIIGGGLPIGAVGGANRLMERLAPVGDVYHGGTFAGHPLSMASGSALLAAIDRREPYARLTDLTERLACGIRSQATDADVRVTVNRVGSMLTVFFCKGPVRDGASARAASRERFATWARALQQQGILIAPSPNEAIFISAAHTRAHIDSFLDASRLGLARVIAEHPDA